MLEYIINVFVCTGTVEPTVGEYLIKVKKSEEKSFFK